MTIKATVTPGQGRHRAARRGRQDAGVRRQRPASSGRPSSSPRSDNDLAACDASFRRTARKRASGSGTPSCDDTLPGPPSLSWRSSWGSSPPPTSPTSRSTPTASPRRAAPICSSTPTTRWTGIPGATRRSPRRRRKASSSSFDRLQLLPLVPRHGARVVRERGGGQDAQRRFRLHQGGSRGAARHRQHLHDGPERPRPRAAAGRCRCS